MNYENEDFELYQMMLKRYNYGEKLVSQIRNEEKQLRDHHLSTLNGTRKIPDYVGSSPKGLGILPSKQAAKKADSNFINANMPNLGYTKLHNPRDAGSELLRV